MEYAEQKEAKQIGLKAEKEVFVSNYPNKDFYYNVRKYIFAGRLTPEQ